MAITDRFYHGSFRKITIAFGTLFNHMKVDKDGSDFDVPLMYSSKSKWWAQAKQNANQDNLGAIQLPRMGYIMGSPTFDPTRKVSSLGKMGRVHPTDPSSHLKLFNPVPYNIPFTLFIAALTVDEGLQLIEQILPFFTPSFNITINEIDEMGIIRDVPIILEDVSHDDNYEGGFDETRLLTWDLTFKVEANIYGPIKTQKIIKKIVIDSIPVTTDVPETTVSRVENSIEPPEAFPTSYDLDEAVSLVEYDTPKI